MVFYVVGAIGRAVAGRAYFSKAHHLQPTDTEIVLSPRLIDDHGTAFGISRMEAEEALEIIRQQAAHPVR